MFASEEEYLYWENQGKEGKGIEKAVEIEEKINRNKEENKNDKDKG